MNNHYSGGKDSVAAPNVQEHDQWEGEQHLQMYLNNVPADISSQYYKYQPTYASLQDVIESRRQSQVGPLPPEFSEDSDRMSSASSVAPDQPTSVFKGTVQGEQATDADGNDVSTVYPDPSRLQRHSASADCLEQVVPSSSAQSREDALRDVDDLSEDEYHAPTPAIGYVNGVDEQLPPIPPEPVLLPTPHAEVPANEPPKLVLDGPHLPMKHHVRARTFPLRTRPMATQIAEAVAHGHVHVHHKHVRGLPHSHIHVHSMQEPDLEPRTKHTAPRFKGFGSLPPPNPSARPLHLQPHPGRVRPLPPADPRSHFAPNPGPLALPLPRRTSSPPAPVDPVKDAFYHELKSKLWKLAQELELRQPQRVTIPEDAELPSPDPEYDDDFDYADGFDECDEADDECYPGEQCESIIRMSVRRRSSEGKGRKAARERAENARMKWFGGPD